MVRVGAVADEDGAGSLVHLLLGLAHLHLVRRRRLGGGAQRRGQLLGRAGGDGDDRGADGDGVALGDEQRVDGPGVGGRKLDERLRRLDLDDHLVDRDLVAGRDLPGDDLRLRQALADIRQGELRRGH